MDIRPGLDSHQLCAIRRNLSTSSWFRVDRCVRLGSELPALSAIVLEIVVEAGGSGINVLVFIVPRPSPENTDDILKAKFSN